MKSIAQLKTAELLQCFAHDKGSLWEGANMKHNDQGQLFLFQTVHTANGEKYDYYKDYTETEVSHPSTQTILWRYAIVDGRKTDIFDAASGDKGLCPLCGELLVARKGKIRAPHWWHKNGRNCDRWYEPKGA